MDCDVCRDGYCPSCDTNFSAEIVRLEQTLATHDRINVAEIERLRREVAYWKQDAERLEAGLEPIRRERDEARKDSRRLDFIGDHCAVTWQGAPLNQIGCGAPTLREEIDRRAAWIHDAARAGEGKSDG